MELCLKKDGLKYDVKEDDRTIYTVKIEENERSTNIVLYNAYENPVMTLSGAKKWYSKVLNNKKQTFVFMVDNTEVGSIKPSKSGYEACYHDVVYRFFGGKENSTFCIRGYDRKHQELQLMLYDAVKFKFRNTSMQGFYTLIAVYMKVFCRQQFFDQTAFESLDKDVYQDAYVYVQK